MMRVRGVRVRVKVRGCEDEGGDMRVRGEGEGVCMRG